jgi:tetratricopeptide (TPR) repeat protein
MLASYLKKVAIDEIPLETKQETLLHLDTCVQHNRELVEGLSHFDHHLDIASSFAKSYYSQACYGEAVELFKRALATREGKLGGTHPNTLKTAEHLANAYRHQGLYNEAENLFKRILTAFHVSLEERSRTIKKQESFLRKLAAKENQVKGLGLQPKPGEGRSPDGRFQGTAALSTGRPALNGRLLIPHIRRSQDMDPEDYHISPLYPPYLSGLAHSIIGIARPVRPRPRV